MTMKNFDLGILCGQFLSMKDHEAKVEKNIFIGLKKETIAYIGTENKKEECEQYIDASQKLVMPGLVNSHAHLPMQLFRGLADDESFDVWLWQHILPLEAKLVSPEFVKLGTRMALLEALSFGITSIYDMYYFENDIADVCHSSGIRAVVGETFGDFPAPDNKNQNRNDLKIAQSMLEKYGTNHSHIRPILAPHAPYTCSDETLSLVRDFALKNKMTIGIHVSETKGELEKSLTDFQKSPVKRLHDLGVSEAPCIYAHCVHVDDADIALIKKKNVRIAHNPEANMKLGAGAAPVPKFIKAGIPTGLGTDGVASNNDFNLWKEMDFAAKLAKLSNSDNTAMTASDALRLTTSKGAEVLGFEKTGQLREGYLADFLILNLNDVNLIPSQSTISSLVYSTTGREVESVYCHGKQLFHKGEFKTLDKEKIIKECETYIAKNF
jgi:5-methylthioadenosine/S-adenosylhomocysteine deaminase